MKTRTLFALLATWLAAGAAADAQTAKTPALPTADEVVALSPFTVSTVRDTGYAATSTLAGGVVGRGMQPSSVLVPEGTSNAAYVRLVTYGLGIMGPYQMWWDFISIGTTPLGNP